MSRIGKIPVDIPEKVKVQVSDQRVEVEGPKGKLSLALPPLASVAVNDNQVVVTRADDTKPSKAQHGLTRSLVQNMVIGVTTGFTRQLEIQGVGFKATLANAKITLNLGYSHEIVYLYHLDRRHHRGEWNALKSKAGQGSRGQGSLRNPQFLPSRALQRQGGSLQ